MTRKVAISEFKTHCLKILKNLEKDKSSIVITKRDKPLVKISPLTKQKKFIFGLLKDKAEIKKDIIKPIEESWYAEK